MNKIQTFGLGAATLLSTGAFAEDGASSTVSTVISSFQTDAITSVTAIGIAMITVGAVAIGFKWAKAALFI
ncbi:hypothetical protein [Vibrio bivalvicida]|uniref:Uncharacterized protein n=1 Tax=Vibrio bivalvicida TaxID=1276888 RepID=A0ABV4MMX2_9VIBR